MHATRFAPRILRHCLPFLGLLLLSPLGCHTRDRSQTPATFRVMTYNIHHGAGLDGKLDLQRIADLIQRERADIVALQEVDKGVQRTDRRDLPAELAALTGLTWLFSNNFHYQGGEYGNALLTRYPVRRWANTHCSRLSPGEQRGVLQAVLQVQGRELVVLDTHFDLSEAERLRNADAIHQLVPSYRPNPIILCGDFNANPGSSVYRRLAEQFADAWPLAGAGEGNTIPADKPSRRIDFIWLSATNSLVPLRAWVPQTDASDHLPVVADLQLR